MQYMQDLPPQNQVRISQVHAAVSRCLFDVSSTRVRQAIIVTRVTLALFLLIGLPSYSFIELSTWEEVVNTLSTAARNLGSGDYSYIGTVCLLRALDRLVRALPRIESSEAVLKVLCCLPYGSLYSIKGCNLSLLVVVVCWLL